MISLRRQGDLFILTESSWPLTLIKWSVLVDQKIHIFVSPVVKPTVSISRTSPYFHLQKSRKDEADGRKGRKEFQENSRLPDPPPLPTMINRIDNIVINTVQPIPILPLPHRLIRHAKLLICLPIHRIPHLVVMTSPIADLEFVVRVHRRGIEDDEVRRCHSMAGIPFPEITVDEAWFDFAGVEGTEEPWDYVGCKTLGEEGEIGPGAIGFDVEGADVIEEVGEEEGPAAFPG